MHSNSSRRCLVIAKGDYCAIKEASSGNLLSSSDNLKKDIILLSKVPCTRSTMPEILAEQPAEGLIAVLVDEADLGNYSCLFSSVVEIPNNADAIIHNSSVSADVQDDDSLLVTQRVVYSNLKTCNGNLLTISACTELHHVSEVLAGELKCKATDVEKLFRSMEPIELSTLIDCVSQFIGDIKPAKVIFAGRRDSKFVIDVVQPCFSHLTILRGINDENIYNDNFLVCYGETLFDARLLFDICTSNSINKENCFAIAVVPTDLYGESGCVMVLDSKNSKWTVCKDADNKPLTYESGLDLLRGGYCPEIDSMLEALDISSLADLDTSK